MWSVFKVGRNICLPLSLTEKPPITNKVNHEKTRFLPLRGNLFVILVLVLTTLIGSFIHHVSSLNQFLISKETNKLFRTLNDSNKQNVNELPWPRIAWLLSFPASGTTFTLNCIKAVSNKTVAKNMVASNNRIDEEGYSVPVHPKYSDGPFVEDKIKDLPNRYILTKTHCQHTHIGRGVHEFRDMCCSGLRRVPMKVNLIKNLSRREPVQYDVEIVKKAVHLFRNPFDNVVARFNNRQKSNTTYTNWLRNHPKEHEDAFHAWCNERDSGIKAEDMEYLGNPFPEVPCRKDLFLYVQWHNQAFMVTKDLGIPTLLLHYEDYAADFDVTLSRLLSFLELERVGQPLPFSKHDYPDFFSKEQKAAIIDWMKELASKETWEQLQYYFS